jgi:hypothetical protein
MAVASASEKPARRSRPKPPEASAPGEAMIPTAPPAGELTATTIEQVLLGGDLSRLSAADRVRYYAKLCESLGLNPLSKPFEYLVLNGKLQLYARKDCTEQLRLRRKVSIERLEKEFREDLYIVTAYGRDGEGRTDVGTGAVTIGNLRGEAKANALMKAETKAKRRLTLSICGLGVLDESELDSIPGARPASTEVVVRTIADLPEHGEPADPKAASSSTPYTPPARGDWVKDEAPAPPPDERPELQPGQYWVEEVKVATSGTSKRTGRPYTLFKVAVHTGEEFGTFSTTIADEADRCRREGLPVAITLTQKKYGPEVATLEAVARPGEDLPF